MGLAKSGEATEGYEERLRGCSKYEALTLGTAGKIGRYLYQAHIGIHQYMLQDGKGDVGCLVSRP